MEAINPCFPIKPFCVTEKGKFNCCSRRAHAQKPEPDARTTLGYVTRLFLPNLVFFARARRSLLRTQDRRVLFSLSTVQLRLKTAPLCRHRSARKPRVGANSSRFTPTELNGVAPAEWPPMAAGRFLRRRYAGGGSIVRVGDGGSSAALLPRSLNQDPVAVRRNSETRDLTRRSGARYTPSHAVRTRAADGVPCFSFLTPRLAQKRLLSMFVRAIQLPCYLYKRSF